MGGILFRSHIIRCWGCVSNHISQSSPRVLRYLQVLVQYGGNLPDMVKPGDLEMLVKACPADEAARDCQLAKDVDALQMAMPGVCCSFVLCCTCFIVCSSMWGATRSTDALAGL